MALFHLQVNVVQRSSGGSAVSAAAYLEDRALKDERQGKTFRYGSNNTKKHKTTICLGSRLPSGKPVDTQKLWNLAEAAEKRKDGRTARRMDVALQIEHDQETHKRQIEEFRSWLEREYGVATTAAIHYEHEENPHFHMIFTTRKVNDDLVFEEKTKVLDDWKSGPVEIEKIREAWANICNRDLAPDNKINHLSFEKRGIEITPTIHVGMTAARMHKQGTDSDRWKENERIKKQRQKELEAILTEEEIENARKRLRIGDIGISEESEIGNGGMGEKPANASGSNLETSNVIRQSETDVYRRTHTGHKQPFQATSRRSKGNISNSLQTIGANLGNSQQTATKSRSGSKRNNREIGINRIQNRQVGKFFVGGIGSITYAIKRLYKNLFLNSLSERLKKRQEDPQRQ